ncbi:hypothetical protein [Bacillus manliponensis]|uniref:hypothetical protein n=1 Tax=Bacillus manliponensis TaxID=574376 RepID=UPI0035186903
MLKQGRFLIILGILPPIFLILSSSGPTLEKVLIALLILFIGALTFYVSILVERFYKKKQNKG